MLENLLGFRVWDVENKQMVDMEYDNEHSEWPMRVDHTGKLGYEPEHYIPMQSTGLPDIAGNPIFEGDILEFEFSDNNFAYKLVEEATLFLLGFREFLHILEFNNSKVLHYKVVGNLFENPGHIGLIE